MIRTTNEYVEFKITDTRENADLSGDTVVCVIIAQGPPDFSVGPIACTFVAVAADQSGQNWYRFRTTSSINMTTVNYPATYYNVYAKVTDSPEIPVVLVGGFSLND